MIPRPTARSQAASDCGGQTGALLWLRAFRPAKMASKPGQAMRGIERAFAVLTVVSAAALIAAVGVFVFR
jgi:hypothetical protein